jgi:hypothetical protein
MRGAALRDLLLQFPAGVPREGNLPWPASRATKAPTIRLYSRHFSANYPRLRGSMLFLFSEQILISIRSHRRSRFYCDFKLADPVYDVENGVLDVQIRFVNRKNGWRVAALGCARGTCKKIPHFSIFPYRYFLGKPTRSCHSIEDGSAAITRAHFSPRRMVRWITK